MLCSDSLTPPFILFFFYLWSVKSFSFRPDKMTNFQGLDSLAIGNFQVHVTPTIGRYDEVEKPTFFGINERQVVDEVETLKETCVIMQQILIENNLRSSFPNTTGPSQGDTSDCNENVDE
ncbi:hypothetical protein R6Q59_007378 [Mikania micrantha]